MCLVVLPACLCIYMCVPDAHSSQKRVSIRVLGIENESSGGAASALYH